VTLDDLRQRLQGLDREILGLVARRQELARQVGELKDQGALALRDFRRKRRFCRHAA
jgi:chorismate mutase